MMMLHDAVRWVRSGRKMDSSERSSWYEPSVKNDGEKVGGKDRMVVSAQSIQSGRGAGGRGAGVGRG
jgi:hypothetical protein